MTELSPEDIKPAPSEREMETRAQLLRSRGQDVPGILVRPSPDFRQTPFAMSDEKLLDFKMRLTSERKAITDRMRSQEEEEISLFRESDDDLFEQVSDPSLEVLEKLTDSEARLLDKIDLALSRIENGSYGICVSCGGEIPLERLEAKPSVSLCRECQTEHEAESPAGAN
jgi:DnaK suppressor protein